MSESASQERILYQLKRLGPQTARVLAGAMGVTTMAIRQHLSQLEYEGLVDQMPGEQQGRGRPAHHWKLTVEGHARFPDAHGQVTGEIIATIRDLYGESALATIIDRRTKETLAHYQDEMADCDTIEEKVNTLCRLRTEEGYMAEYEVVEDGFLLKEHHCPICVAARTCQGFCQSELQVFQTLFEQLAKVVREDHLLAGARRCTYRIVPIGEE